MKSTVAIVAGLAGAVIGLSQPILAQTTFYYISSIAYDPVTGALGWATGFLYTHDAVQAAKEVCRKHGGTNCKTAIPAFNSCGALSAGSNGEAYWGIGQNKDLAEHRALDSCGKDASHGCKVLVSLCSQAGQLAPMAPSPILPHPTTPPQPTTPQVVPCPSGTQRGLGGCYGY